MSKKLRSKKKSVFYLGKHTVKRILYLAILRNLSANFDVVYQFNQVSLCLPGSSGPGETVQRASQTAVINTSSEVELWQPSQAEYSMQSYSPKNTAALNYSKPQSNSLLEVVLFFLLHQDNSNDCTNKDNRCSSDKQPFK